MSLLDEATTLLDQAFEAHDQASRRYELRRLHRAAARGLYDTQGRFIASGHHEWRHLLWHACSLLEGQGEDQRLAQLLLEQAVDLDGGHFWVAACSSILIRHGGRIEPRLQNRLIDRLRELLPHETKARFHGYNDNFPSMAALGLLVGSHITGQRELIEPGIIVLESALRMLKRRGVLSEYTSPTYSPITLACMAEIVEHCPDPHARHMAMEIEQAVWRDVLAHFHPSTSFLAGPHSRAYGSDLCAHPHNAHVVLYLVLGKRCFTNPVSEYNCYDGQGRLCEATMPAAWAQAAWYSTPTYHPDDASLALAEDQRFPRIVQATAEQGAFPRNWGGPGRHPATPSLEFQACETHLHTLLERDFALGTSSRPWLDGHQHTAFHLVYRHKRPATCLKDIATVFTRYVINDKWHSRAQHYVPDEGRTIGLAHQATSMVLYWPKPGWTATPPAGDALVDPVHSLKLVIYLASFWSQPDELWLGDRRMDTWQGDSENVVPVFICHGPVYVAIHPLIGSNLGRDKVLRLGRHDGFLRIELINFEHKPRNFDLIELLTCRNGMVVEVSDVDRWSSFQSFRTFHASPTIHDRWHEAGGMREVLYRREGLELAMEISPVSEGIKYRSVNGRVPIAPRWDVRLLDEQPEPGSERCDTPSVRHDR